VTTRTPENAVERNECWGLEAEAAAAEKKRLKKAEKRRQKAQRNKEGSYKPRPKRRREAQVRPPSQRAVVAMAWGHTRAELHGALRR